MKKLLVAFSSWCGCRYDLPGWQSLHDELSPRGFHRHRRGHRPVGRRTSARGPTASPCPSSTIPIHLLTELYAVSNVPTVVWIDEQNRIARPNGKCLRHRSLHRLHRRRVRSAPGRGAPMGAGRDRAPRTGTRPARRWATCPPTRCWPGCTSGWPPRPTARATRPSPGVTCPSHRRWPRTISPSGGRACRWWARTRSVTTSWPGTRRGSSGACPTTGCRRWTERAGGPMS